MVLKMVGGELVNRSYWKALDGGDCVSVGLHEDVFVADGHGGLLCRERVIRHVWTKAGGHVERAKPAEQAK